jgi:hypothetical protein
MNTLCTGYETPQLIEQGSAITLTQATDTGSCWDGCQGCNPEFDECPCSGSGSSCAKETDQ